MGAGRQGPIVRGPHQPHYQTLDYNPLNGGVERWFKPITEEIGDGASMRTILEYCRALFGRLAHRDGALAHRGHQFRIEARSGEQGKPTPEGMHRDGVDYVLVLLVNRRNIASGTTTVHDLDKRTLGSFTLTDPLDAALVDDARCYHGVTPVEPENPAQPAYRDVLVVTFRKKASLTRVLLSLPRGGEVSAADRHAAVGDQGLAGDEGAGLAGQQHRQAADVVGLAEAAQRRRRLARRAPLRILVQGAREVRRHQAGRDGVHADIVGPVLDREVARELHVGRLGDAVGADHRACRARRRSTTRS